MKHAMLVVLFLFGDKLFAGPEDVIKFFDASIKNGGKPVIMLVGMQKEFVGDWPRDWLGTVVKQLRVLSHPQVGEGLILNVKSEDYGDTLVDYSDVFQSVTTVEVTKTEDDAF